ncbi:hypothetical protein [Dyella monticola]|uniref:hypothetical protein n=1 Tax=Dyella monticola TaxID=1927958 RepID=UPI001314B18F|nr:hypothetical protein [Dyella monticola]
MQRIAEIENTLKKSNSPNYRDERRTVEEQAALEAATSRAHDVRPSIAAIAEINRK